nr:PREDICTED: uncharacterized protein LOC107078833 [Lepisosteus oculatus]
MFCNVLKHTSILDSPKKQVLAFGLCCKYEMVIQVPLNENMQEQSTDASGNVENQSVGSRRTYSSHLFLTSMKGIIHQNTLTLIFFYCWNSLRTWILFPVLSVWGALLDCAATVFTTQGAFVTEAAHLLKSLYSECSVFLVRKYFHPDLITAFSALPSIVSTAWTYGIIKIKNLMMHCVISLSCVPKKVSMLLVTTFIQLIIEITSVVPEKNGEQVERLFQRAVSLSLESYIRSLLRSFFMTVSDLLQTLPRLCLHQLWKIRKGMKRSFCQIVLAQSRPGSKQDPGHSSVLLEFLSGLQPSGLWASLDICIPQECPFWKPLQPTEDILFEEEAEEGVGSHQIWLTLGSTGVPLHKRFKQHHISRDVQCWQENGQRQEVSVWVLIVRAMCLTFIIMYLSALLFVAFFMM